MDYNNFILIIDMLENERNRQALRINRRNLRDNSDPLTLPENVFKSIFRLSPQLAHDLILDLEPFFRVPQREDISIPANLKILTALQFFGQGSYQKAVGQDYLVAMSQSSVSRSIHEVAEVIIDQMGFVVRFPISIEEKDAEKRRFGNILNGFPGIIGAIDCSHVSIIAPPTNHPEHPAILFLNRKGYYSVNTQIICNAELKILAINARYPGSVHDSAIWQTSAIRQHLLNSYNQGDTSSWLIGDSGYPLEPWLMTPVAGANKTPAEVRYNTDQRRIRNVIERTNGALKSRFRCLLKHRVLHYDPEMSGKIINVCAILHNVCIERNEVDLDDLEEYVEDEDEDDDDDEEDGNNINYNNNLLHNGRLTRNRIINDYFQN